MVLRGRAEDRVDHILTWGSGRIVHNAIDHKLERFSLCSHHGNLVARSHAAERPEDRRVTSHAIYMTGDNRVPRLSRCGSQVVPEDACPIHRMKGFRDGRIHRTLTCCAYID